MQADVTHFEEFYRSALGRLVIADLARSIIAPKTRPHAMNLCAGLGYSLPYLRDFQPLARAQIALMPAQIGALQDSNVPQVLCVPTLLPLRDNSVGALLMIHLLEFSENPKLLLRETWRVLEDGASLTLVAPYRRGLWARSSDQPFGLGTPYTRARLRELLEANGFTVESTKLVLNFPPAHNPRQQKMRWLFEKMSRLLTFHAGAVVVRAKKSPLRPTMIGKRYTVTSLEQLIPSNRQPKPAQSRDEA